MTFDVSQYIDPSEISIHTSAREVTDPSEEIAATTIFQSTLPQGKWLRCGFIPVQVHDFNPHFRKGSDSISKNCFWCSTDFNPHFRKGSDHASGQILLQQDKFQSTLPQGKWLYPIMTNQCPSEISIHTSAREVTLALFDLAEIYKFQSTLPQGKWLDPGGFLIIGCLISIHTSAREVT